MALISRGATLASPEIQAEHPSTNPFMDQRIRAVEHIKAVNVAHRIEKTLQAFVASVAVFNPNDIGVRRRARAVSGWIVLPVRAGML